MPGKDDLSPQYARLSDAKRTLLERRLRGQNAARAEKHRVIKPVLRGRDLPVSFSQERMCFIQLLDPGNIAYNTQVAIHFKGPLDESALEHSLKEIVRRHEIYRTSFPIVAGRPVQRLHPEQPVHLRRVDISSLVGREREIEARRITREDITQPFRLDQLPLVRWTLIRLGKEQYSLLLVQHHTVTDGWSLKIFLEELMALYSAFVNGSPSPLREPRIQFADFASWQRTWMGGEDAQRGIDYWKQKLQGSQSIMELPIDRPRPLLQTFRGAQEMFEVDPDLMRLLRGVAVQAKATMFMTFFAAFMVLLHRYSGSNDISVGMGVANRHLPETDDVIGMFINTVVLRTNISGNPIFRELLAQVRTLTLEAYTHQEVPFDKVVETVGPARDLRVNPLHQIMFNFQNYPLPKIKFPNLIATLEMPMNNGSAKFDLNVSVWLHPGQRIGTLQRKDESIKLSWEYNTDLFDATTIQRMALHFQNILRGVVTDPDLTILDIPMIHETERHQLLVEWNNNDTDYPRDRCIHTLFEEQAERTPDAIAGIFDSQRLTYRELNVKSNQLAHYLRKLGVGPEVMVGVCVERSLEMLIGFLGILKAGGTYVPMDPAYPKERLSFMVEDTSVPVILTQQRLVDILPANVPEITCLDTPEIKITQESKENPVSGATGAHPAYVMYTSGSTGRPKGVCVSHRAVNRLVVNTNYISLGPSDSVAQVSNFSFDAATFEIWGALLHGACLVGIPKDVIISPEDFAARIREQRISVLFLTTALLNQMAREVPIAFSTIKCLLFGGETAAPASVRKILEAGPPERFLHMYGPTESTTFTTWYPVESVAENAATIPIGRPVSHTTVYLLDTNRQPVPIGVAGELFIGGDGLAEGYLNNPHLTKEKFVQNPFDREQGARLYRTGDLARYLHDGNIEFVGRLDNQVKIRGFRIEPGEIEAILEQHPAVKDSIVIACPDQSEGKCLIAYVLSGDNSSKATYALRDFLLEKLPEYMIPSRFVMLDSFPLTPNGKVDRQALQAMADSVPGPKTTFVAPGNTLEKQLAGAWQKVLGLQQVGITDNFFALGGHSLLAVQLMAEIKKVTGQQIPVLTIFQSPTIEQLAERIRKGDCSDQLSSTIQVNPHTSKLPLFWVHHTFLARHLEPDQPLCVVYPSIPDKDIAAHSTIESITTQYLQEMRSIQPKGPYVLGGFCFCAAIALKMARQLIQQGDEVSLLFLVEPSSRLLPSDGRPANSSLKEMFVYHSRKLGALKGKDKISYFLQKLPYVVPYIKIKVKQSIKIARCKTYIFFKKPLPMPLKRFYIVRCCTRRQGSLYTPEVYPGSVVIFHAEKKLDGGVERKWNRIASDRMNIHTIPGTEHLTIIQEPCLSVLSGHINRYLKQIQAKEYNHKT